MYVSSFLIFFFFIWFFSVDSHPPYSATPLTGESLFLCNACESVLEKSSGQPTWGHTISPWITVAGAWGNYDWPCLGPLLSLRKVV